MTVPWLSNEQSPVSPGKVVDGVLELAAATSTDERYAREWLEQQTVTGYLAVIDAAGSPTDRRYRLGPAAAEVLTTRDSLSCMAPFAKLVTALASNASTTCPTPCRCWRPCARW